MKISNEFYQKEQTMIIAFGESRRHSIKTLNWPNFFSSFNPFPFLPSVATDDRKQSLSLKISFNYKPTMRDKSVETLSFQRVFWCMLFNYYRLAQKTTLPSPKQSWISYCTNDGLCSGTTLNLGRG